MGVNKAFLKTALIGTMFGALALSGCSEATSGARQGTAEHEVLTLTPVDQDKMMITMRGIDGVQVQEMETALEEKFPDMDLVVSNNTWLQSDLTNNSYQDLVLVSDNEMVNWETSDKFIDLSGESFTQNYYLSSMWESAGEDGLFFLPGPSNIYGVIYNKDMFAQYGWELPTTLDGFIELCKTIESQGIRSIQPALYYNDAGRQLFTGFTYEPIFAGLTNNLWYEDYRAGKAGMAGHMEPAFEIMQRFVDAGILRPEDYEMRPGTRTDMMYVEKSCAMILETQDAVKYSKKYGGENAPAIGMLPFFSGNGQDSDYLLAVPNYFIAANKTLEQPGNEKKLARIMEILAYISTAEGQKAIVSGDSTRISSVRGTEWGYNDFLENVKATIEKGNVARQPFFVGSSNSEVDKTLKADMQLFAQGSITADEMMADLDKARDQVLAEKDSLEKTTVIGMAEDSFSVLQTAQLFADIFRKSADAQIGLCMANMRNGGCNFRLHKGELAFGGGTGGSLEYTIGESFQKNSEDGSMLTKVSMTGEALLQVLNEVYSPSQSYPNAYWTAAGLKITFAPWAGEGNRIVSVTLADGSAIVPTELYTVAVWNGTVNPERITQVEASYEDPAAELFRAYVEAAGSIRPELDKEFILKWDQGAA